ncbi:MAG TPA: SPFH domain-containing protein [Rhodoglobus sp.]|nr:SPFH domain-containing protein [Rhodoglobus sp.]
MNKRSPWAPLIALGSILAIVGVIFAGIAYVDSLNKADGGEVIVVRNGGLFDDNQFREIVTTADGLTSTGWWSQIHRYPTTQRYFKVGPGGDSNEQINVPTKDGVQVGIEGTFYFELNQDPAVLQAFDDAYGTRTFPNAQGEQVAAWDVGEDGWSAFLSATMGNLVQNVLRQEIGKVTCPELVASCILAQNAPTGNQATTVQVDQNAPDLGNNTLTTIQDGVNKTFAVDVEKQLGLPLFTNISFAASKVTLPDNVQNAINVAQQSVADANGRVASAQAGQAEATALAAQNAAKQQGYDACPACAEIDRLKALPQGITVYAPGSQYAVTSGN